MSNIDPDTEQYFEDYLEMFATPGWQRFLADLAGSLESDQKTAVQRCDTTEKWFEERGLQARTMKLLSFETLVRNQYEQLQSEENLDDAE